MKLLLVATAAAGTYALRAPTQMSVAVFGATGLTGRECTHQLLERGVPVRALCRDPAKLLTPLGSTGKEELVENEQLYKYKGSVTSAADVEKVFESGDIEGVIISLGGKTKDVGPTMLTDGTTRRPCFTRDAIDVTLETHRHGHGHRGDEEVRRQARRGCHVHRCRRF